MTWSSEQLPELWRRPIEAGLNAIFPHSCAFCGRVCETLPDFPGACKNCLTSLPFRFGQQAFIAWDTLGTSAAQPLSTRHTQSTLPSGGVYCATWYTDPVREAVLRLKFADRPDIATALAAVLLQCCRRHSLECRAVAAVPLHPARRRERGYNQAELLASKLARQLEKPDWSDQLVRLRPTERQSSLPSHAARQLNLSGAFGLMPSFTQIAGDSLWQDRELPVFLVDDILTTGATLAAAARPLWQVGLPVAGLVVSSDH